MKSKWLITLHGQDADIQNVAYAVQESGREVEIISIGKMVEMHDAIVDHTPQCVVITGGCYITMAAMKNRRYSGLWHDPIMYNCSSYYAYWGKYIAQKEYIMMPLGEVLRHHKKLFASMSKDNRLFIRPDEGEKIFNGEVVALEHYERWNQYVTDIPKHTLCVVSQTIKIAKELRLLICDGTVVTGSTYRINGMIEQEPLDSQHDKEVLIAFAEKVAGDPYPMLPPVYVMDLAVGHDGEISIMEVGCCNAAGLYKMDKRLFVEALSMCAERRYQEWTNPESN